MRIGTALLVMATGLVLRYAVDVEVPGIEVTALGSILALVGLLGLGLAVWTEWRAIRRPPTVRADRTPRAERPRRIQPAEPDPPTPARDRYDPVVGAGEVGDDEVSRVLREASRRR